VLDISFGLGAPRKIAETLRASWTKKVWIPLHYSIFYANNVLHSSYMFWCSLLAIFRETTPTFLSNIQQ